MPYFGTDLNKVVMGTIYRLGYLYTHAMNECLHNHPVLQDTGHPGASAGWSSPSRSTAFWFLPDGAEEGRLLRCVRP